MTDPVSRASSGGGGTPTEADFQGALNGAMRSNGGGNGQSRNANGNASGGAGGGGGNGAGPGTVSFADPYLQGAYKTYIEGDASPVSSETQALINSAMSYDSEAGANPEESNRRWTLARGAIADEAKAMMLTDNAKTPPGAKVDPADFSRTNPRLLALNMWSLSGDRRAAETQKALEAADGDLQKEMRDDALDGLIEDVQGTIDEVNKKNGDENFFRQGWDWMTGGGAREDFADFLEGKRDQLKALEERNARGELTSAEYASGLKSVMGDFEAQFQKHIEDVADSDGTWNTIGEVGRVVAATAAGIIATVAGGGVNLAAGFAAAAITYEAIDLAGDGIAAAKGEDAYADGHVGILTAAFDAAGADGGNFGMSSEHLKTWAMDNSLDLISSAATAGATGAGAAVSRGAVASWAPKLARGSDLGTRIFSTTAGGVTAQTINSVGYVASDATRMGFEGKFDMGQLGQSAKTQGVYIAAALPTSAIAGWIPIQRTLPNAAAGSKAAASAPSQFAYKLNYAGLAGQFVNDGASGFGTAWLADGDLLDMSDNSITKSDAIGALGGTVPGTLQNLSVHPQAQQRLEAWKPFNKSQGQRDLKFTSRTGFPPDAIRLAPITTTVVGLRAMLQGVDVATDVNATKTANDSAVLGATLRSSASKFAWFNGNHKLVRAYNLALAGDPKAIDLFNSIVANRSRHGIKVSGAEQARYAKISNFGDAFTNAQKILSKTDLDNEIRSLVTDGKVTADTTALAKKGQLSDKEQALVELEKAYTDAHAETPKRRFLNPRKKVLNDADKLINFGEEYAAAKPRLDAARREIEALVQLGKAYADARAKLPQDQQERFPKLEVRDLTAPDKVIANLLQDQSIPDSVRNNLQNLRQDARLLEYSNIVEGLLTDPEFVINGIQELAGKKLSPSEIEDLRQIYKTQRTLETYAYRGRSRRIPWTDLTWRTTTVGGKKQMGIFEISRRHLSAYVTKFLGNASTGSAASDAQLKALLQGWQAYVPLHSLSRTGNAGDLAALNGARANYEKVLKGLPAEVQSMLPGSRGLLTENPQAVLTRLRQDENLSTDVRQTLKTFDPDTFFLDRSDIVSGLLSKDNLFKDRIDSLRGKIPDTEFDGIQTILEIHNLLKADKTQGGYNNRQSKTTWNELGWREVDTLGLPKTPGVFDEETKNLDRVVQDFLLKHGTDDKGKVLPDAQRLLDTWKGYIALYSQTQHELAASDYRPGIKRETAEQKNGSSAAPDTKYGYVLKAGAYGAAVNLVYSWMLKATPATHGGTQLALAGAYFGETALAGYNLVGQIGYMKALGAMTRFRAEHDKAQYLPSDIPADMARFDPDLHAQYKALEKRRAKWNKVADWGSSISAGRNLLMSAAFFSMGLPAMGIMSATNAVLSAGWLGMQRGPLQRTLPHGVQNAVRRLSIFGGLALQSGVLAMAIHQADQIKDKKGPEGDAAADWLEDFLNWIIDGLIEDKDPQVADLNDRHPLGDRA